MTAHDARELVALMLRSGLSMKALARRVGLPTGTVRKAIEGKELSPLVYKSLSEECLEEINANDGRTKA